MEALLKLPENWHVVVTEENRDILEKWNKLPLNKTSKIVGVYYDSKRSTSKGQATTSEGYDVNYPFDFGQEISTADFKRLVLGEKNFEDYGVVGCFELINYFSNTKIRLLGNASQGIYFKENNKWDVIHIQNNIRQTLPLQEYLKLIPTETMEKKYEYKLKDEKYISLIVHLIGEHWQYRNYKKEELQGVNCYNVLDLFFDKVEVSFTSMTSIIKGKLTIQLHPTSQVENLKSNGWKITTEEHVNQIRKYLLCNK